MNKAFLCVWRNEVRHLGLTLKRLERQNARSSKPVVAPGGPWVSLTTYGQRLNTVYLAIESIARGSLLPSVMVLWLQQPFRVSELPATLQRLVARGLRVEQAATLGCHTKYFPSLALPGALEQPLVVADDDMLYPRNWLQRLTTAYERNPNAVHCFRAHEIRLEAGEVAPYTSWTPCRSSQPSYRHFATGASGTLLPPRMLASLAASGTAFQALCPAADDVWLHAHTLRAGLPTAQVDMWQHNLPMIPGTQAVTLSANNVQQSQNDVQIARTYTAADRGVLQG